MKHFLAILALTLIAASCGSADTVTTDAPDSVPPTSIVESDPTAELMAAALRQLVTEDHTFGSGPPPFTEYLVQARLDPQAGSGGGAPTDVRSLTGSERAAIEGAIGEYGSVRFIEDPDEWITDELRPTVEGAAILGVGEPDISDTSALVGVSLWCGGLCGTWLTYRAEMLDEAWTVTGIDGPIAIS